MSRKKGKGKGKVSAKNKPHRAPSKRQSSQSWPAQEITPKFSLVDEARWQSSHRTAAYQEGKKLRHLPILFVSAGHLEGTIKEQLRSKIESGSDSESPAPSSLSSTEDNTTAMEHMAIRSPSPAPSASSSSSDEVVFQGRGIVQAAAETSKTTSPPFAPVASSVGHEGPELLSQALSSRQRDEIPRMCTPQLTATSTEDHTSVAEIETRASIDVTIRSAPAPNAEADSDADSVVQDHFAKRRGGRPAWEGTTTEWVSRSKPNIGWLPVEDRPDIDAFLRGEFNPRDAAMADYMQNIEEFGLTGDMMGSAGFARRDMDLDASSHKDWESDKGSQQGEDSQQFAVEDEINDAVDNWDSDDLRDFEDLSTSSDVEDTVVHILSKRVRKTGVQYLCVYEGRVADDARWLPETFLRDDNEKLLIMSFEEEAAFRALEPSDSDSDDDDGDSEDGESAEIDEDIDDETLARVLQKQEELGLGSEEVLLYAGDDYFADSFDSKLFTGGCGKKQKHQNRGRGNRDPVFPSASAMADALAMDPYGAFDIMDTDRPSLKPKKKGRRGQMPPELEDADLNEQLQNAWEADRAKKRLKKAEREELRHQGLLGRKGKAANLSVKYKGGIDMDDVVEEMREFILSDRQSLSLPPMEAARRATIHQAAGFFGLTSRSRGDGHDRFTVLSRTSRTRIYTDAEFDQIMLRRGLYKRLSGPTQSGKGRRTAKQTTFRSGPRLRPQVGYRDGEKVGEHAPELGPDNKGHALMMKMGWTKGMALGTSDNQGILHPIAHTVKTNKAGLQ